MKYNPFFTKKFSKTYSKLNFEMKNKMDKKIKKLCEYPMLGKPMKNKLKGLRRVHIGHFILLYQIENDKVIFYKFDHHDSAYL
ncbi:MAG: type II toxin-antitoxin system RelE/ParE family toxin [Candidatus Nanohalarchaeota archaeon]|nr:MAG: type II toxin-antitoxin system RelE/ParE family toxin [Candidatus Nanohaloarchaeota archaeon]